MAGPKLIAEIGGSSSRWALLAEDGSDRICPEGEDMMPGFNPLNGDADRFINELSMYLEKHCPEAYSAKSLQVYGAGCGAADRKERMAEVLKLRWPDIPIKVDTDLMGAALGACPNGSGLVLILGTGMNAGYFDGSRLHLPMPSLGYVLGDEGSGADIGRVLLQDAFYKRMPEEVRLRIFGADGPDLSAILEEVYRSPFPSKMLASRTFHLAGLLEMHYVRGTIISRFHALAELLKAFFTPEQRAEVYATGSVAYGFRELLGECFLDHGMSLINVTKDPLRDLILYERQR